VNVTLSAVTVDIDPYQSPSTGRRRGWMETQQQHKKPSSSTPLEKLDEHESESQESINYYATACKSQFLAGTFQ
jgi:hypothetical protein